MDLPGYYRDILVWLPDLQHSIYPPCPSCKGNGSIGVHGYSRKTVARRVLGLKTHYFILSRRYICHHCEKLTPKPKYSFRGYNEKSIVLLPRQLNLSFPAILTQKLAIDKSIFDIMRPLFDGGVKPNRFQKMIHELYHKEHMDLSLLHEYSDEGKVQLLSSFLRFKTRRNMTHLYRLLDTCTFSEFI